jgi:hypothetical protein
MKTVDGVEITEGMAVWFVGFQNTITCGIVDNGELYFEGTYAKLSQCIGLYSSKVGAMREKVVILRKRAARLIEDAEQLQADVDAVEAGVDN